MGKGKRNRQLHIEDAVGAPAKHQNKTKKQFVWPKWAKIAICAVLLVAIIGGIVAASLINSGIVYRNRILVESKSGKFDVNQQMAAFILWQTVYQQAFYEYYYTSWGMYQDTNKILENYLSANDYAVISATSYVSNYLKTGINSMEDYLTEMVASADAALEAGLTPIMCCGETLEQREAGITMEHIAMQIKMGLRGVSEDKIRKVVIAYEPIWAIGTGRTATPEQAQEVCEGIRTVVRKLYSSKNARAISILYGGSMNDKNAFELLAQPDIDGGLIGGASLVPEKFVQIIEAANQPIL